MSETSADVRALDVEASAWVIRKDLPEWGEADSAEFENWLNKSARNRVAFLRAHDVWERANRLPALTKPKHREAALSGWKKLLPFIAGGAAVLLLAVFAGTAGYLDFAQPREAVYMTATGGRETVPLGDGSQIELNTGTILRVSETGAKRIVKLDKGEAYFAIKHDAKRPFQVLAADHLITDLGTKFEIRSDGTSLKVTLLEGRARLETASAWSKSPPLLLAPGDVAIASPRGVSLTKAAAKNLADALSWRQGMLVFENTTVVDAVAELNRYNSRKLVVADAAVGRMKIDASVPTDGVDVFARVAREVIGLRVEAHDDEVIISR
jgi:transmembrane sensor